MHMIGLIQVVVIYDCAFFFTYVSFYFIFSLRYTYMGSNMTTQMYFVGLHAGRLNKAVYHLRI